MQPELSIIIVNYNGEKYLTNCLDSIFNHSISVPFEVIVIDNASKDGSFQILQNYPHTIELTLNTKNLGFSTANNQGIRVAKGRYLFFLNNDTIVQADAISTLLAYVKAHPQVGLLGPKLLNEDGSLQSPGSILGRWQYWGDTPKEVSFLAGAAWMTEASLMHELGGFDEKFFFYNEDIDLCKRVVKAGRKLIYYPEAAITHFGGGSTQSNSEKAIVEGYRGGLYFCYKHYGKWIYWLYCGVLLLLLPLLCIGNFSAYRQVLRIILKGDIYHASV